MGNGYIWRGRPGNVRWRAAEGYPLVYEPDAIVRHPHRRDYAGLKRQMTDNGIGLCSYFVDRHAGDPGEAAAIIRFGLWWLWKGHIRRLLIGLSTRSYPP